MGEQALVYSDVGIDVAALMTSLMSELTRVRTAHPDALAKAEQIRSGLNAGALVNLPEVLNSPLIRVLIQQQVALKAQMAQLSATLPPQHPGMKDIATQIADLDRHVVAETAKVADALAADARVAAARGETVAESAVAASAALVAIALLGLIELAGGRPMRRPTATEPGGAAVGTGPVAAKGELAASAATDATPLPPPPPSMRSPREPAFDPAFGVVPRSLSAIAGDIGERGSRRVLVTTLRARDLAPLVALALARAVAMQGASVVLVDLSGNDASALEIGEGPGLAGIADVFDNAASYADVLFRDAHSQVHYVPAGRRALSPAELEHERLETLLAALSLTYDHVVIDAREDMVAPLAGVVARAVVASPFPATDPRTQRAVAALRTAAPVEVEMLRLDAPAAREVASTMPQAAAMA